MVFGNPNNPLENMSGIDRAAVYLMNLNSEECASVMKHLGPKEVQKIGLAMKQVENISKDQLNAVMDSFISDANERTSIGVGNDDYIRDVLTNALGEDKASGVIDRILQGGNTKGLDTLKWMDARGVTDIIKLEHPQIQSIVLSYLDPDHAAQIMSNFDEKVRLDLILRISTLESVQPNALMELNDILESQFSSRQGGSNREIGGIQAAANILNFVDSTIETELMTELKDRDPDLGQKIQDLMFVFDNLVDVDDRAFQMLLKEISSDTLIMALKGADVSVKEKIFANMSKRAAELLRDDLEAKGPVKVSEVESAQKEILSVARRMADAGEISLGGKGGEEMI